MKNPMMKCKSEGLNRNEKLPQRSLKKDEGLRRV